MCPADWSKPAAGEYAENSIHEHISVFLSLLAYLDSPYPMVVVL